MSVTLGIRKVVELKTFRFTILFNRMFEKIIREIKIKFQIGIELQNASIRLMVYKGDAVLIAESQNLSK